MKKSKFSDSQILEILASVTGDVTVDSVSRQHGISSATFYNWKQKYGSIESDELKRLRELESENSRLKKVVGQLSLTIDVLQETNKELKKR
jgi:putative transposase